MVPPAGAALRRHRASDRPLRSLPAPLLRDDLAKRRTLYYANEVYYAHRGNGYVVVEPPKEEVSQAPSPADQMFIYPSQGQSEQMQAADRYACHRWAVDQTGFDPTQPPGGSPKPQKIEKRADYQRAMSACLDGRGYTVK